MEIIISFFFYLMMFSLTLIEIRRVAKTHSILMISLNNIFFAFFLCGFPALYFSEVKYSPDFSMQLMSFVLTLISYISIQYGYVSVKTKPKKSEKYKKCNITKLASVLMIISVVSLIMYASGYGGIASLMVQANSIRSSNLISENSYTFFKHFIPLTIIASLLVYNAIFVERTVKNPLRFWLLFFLLLVPSVIISIVYIIANDGRALAGMYLIFFILIAIKYLYDNRKITLTKLFGYLGCSLILGWIFIIGSEALMEQARGGVVAGGVEDNNGFSEKLIKEFSFLVSGLLSSIEYIDYTTDRYMFFNDTMNGVFAWLPTSLKPIQLPDVWDINTELIDNTAYGQYPTSIVAQSYYDLGILGVILIPMLWGKFIKIIENFFSNHKNIIFSTLYMVVAFYFGKSMLYFSLYNIMMNIFFIVMTFIIYKFLNRRTVTV